MHSRRRCRQRRSSRRCSIDLRDATSMMLLGDLDWLVARSSMLSPSPPRARRRARSSNVCISIDDVRSSFVGSLGSWLTVLIDVKRWRGMDIRLGKHLGTPSSTRSNSHRQSCPSCPSHPILTQTACHRPRLDASIVPSVPPSRLSRHSPSPRKQHVRFLPASIPSGKCPRGRRVAASRPS